MDKCTRRSFIKSMGVSALSLIVSPWALSACGSEKTGPFDFVQMCDPQLGFGGYEHDLSTFRQAVKQINALAPAFVVICGDLVDDAEDKLFADFKAIKAKLKVPCYCAPGNHDVGNEATAESLKYYREVIGKDYYSFEYGGYTFLVVNTQLWKAPLEGESEKHDAWFRSELKEASEKMRGVFVIGHYPLYLRKVDESERYENLPKEKRAELLNLFEEHGVVAMLGGHRHKTIINDYNGIQLVNAETTSKNIDGRPMGFRIWHVVEPRPFKHEFVPLDSNNIEKPGVRWRDTIR